MTQLDELEFWIDLNLPPQMASWLKDGFEVNAKSFKDLLFSEVADVEVYKIAAKQHNKIIITTKDIDFSNYQNMVGAAPRILYLNIGNISNKNCIFTGVAPFIICFLWELILKRFFSPQRKRV